MSRFALRHQLVGLRLPVLHVSEIPTTVKNKVRMLADDTKIWNKIWNFEDSIRLQDDLDRHASWSELAASVQQRKMQRHAAGTPKRNSISYAGRELGTNR